jgi:hypothetical protein
MESNKAMRKAGGRKRHVATFSSMVGLTMLLLVLFATCDAWGRDEDPPPPVVVVSPAYTLVVDSDSPDLDYEVLRTRLSTELGGSIAPPSSGNRPTRAAISIRLRQGTLTVKTVHVADERVLERSITARGDSASMTNEAVLLAGNLARDEARELLDALGTKPPREEPVPTAPPPLPPPPPPTQEEKDTPFEEGSLKLATVAFIFPIASNEHEPNTRSLLDFSLIYGRVGRVEAYQMGFGVAHAARGGLRGTQLAGGVAISEGPTYGAQIAIGANLASGTGSDAGLKGAQLATGFNYARRGVTGAQISAGVNMTRGPVTGVTIAAIMNLNTEEIHGTQGAAWINIADKVKGSQLSVVNVSNDVTGAQLGVVNIGRKVKGLQLGAVNIAEEVDGAAIGLASISKDSFHPIAWGSNLAYTNAGVKFATKYVYTVTAIGVGTNETSFDGGPLITTAIGGHIPLPAAFDVEAECAYSTVDNNNKTNQSLHPRALIGYSFAKHFRLFAGGGPRVPIDFNEGRAVVRPEFMGGASF